MSVRRIFLTTVLALVPGIAFAAVAGELHNPIGTRDIYAFFAKLLQLVAQIAFPIIVLYLVYIGFNFISAAAAGKSEDLKKARESLFWALVGALLVLGAYALSLAIKATVQEL